jgi:hypothetical protein
MFNPYTIILSLFVLAGLLATFWGLVIIIRARKMQHWPVAEGVIEESAIASDAGDLLPQIRFRYMVEKQTYHRSLEFPADITPTQEFAASYVKRYPVGATVPVHYNPENPQHATLEAGPGRGDWLVFAIGLGTLIFGILFLFFGG